MESLSFSASSGCLFQISSRVTIRKTLINPPKKIQFGFIRRPTDPLTTASHSSSSSSSSRRVVLQKSIPLAATLGILLCSNAAKAGILSGFPGIESVPGPQLPQVDFLNRFNEENQKKYAEADARFKSSPLLKQLLERSKLNKEKNRQEILDKYCIRGAEWGVGDCSTEGMSPQDRENFIAMLKEKAGVK